MDDRAPAVIERWLELLAADPVGARIGDLLDGMVFEVHLDASVTRLEGRPDGIHAVPRPLLRGRVVQLRTTLAVLASIARGTLSAKDALAEGAVTYTATGVDARVRTRFLDRAGAAWRLFLLSESASAIQQDLLHWTPDNARESTPPRPAKQATVTVPTVTVFGAGITGLTAAQELVERGFRVQVVEREPGSRGHDMCEVGGMAKTQVVHLPTLGAGPADGPGFVSEPFGDGVSSMVSTRPPFELHEHVDFPPGQSRLDRAGLLDAWGRSNGDRLRAMLEELRRVLALQSEEAADRSAAARKRGLGDVAAGPTRLRVLVGGHFRGMKPSPDLAMRRAKVTARELTARLGPDADKFDFVVDVIEDREPWSETGTRLSGELLLADRSDRVDLRLLDERIAPGEHGYRFFPAFYRNLFHTMRRIPLFDDKGRETGHTTYDNLLPTEALLIVPFEGQGTVEVPRRRIRTFEGMRKVLRGLYERLHFEYRDIALFEIRLSKFMATCWQRRREIARTTSWREYIGVSDFTPEFQDFLLDAPQALVAMNAEEIDARTHGNISVQLLLDQVGLGAQSDMTLNGPTTNAFLKPWKDYLKHHGVRFFLGELTAIRRSPEGRMLPAVGPSSVKPPPLGAAPRSEPVPEGPYPWMPETDYYVLALPVEHAWRIVGDIPEADLDGDIGQLRTWYDTVQDEIRRTLPRSPIWVPGEDIPRHADHRPVGPLRDFAGIQFYFNYALQIGATGHIYYVNTPWGLSSFNQPPFWRVRRVLERHRYLSGISIDLGHWYNVAGPLAAGPEVRSAIDTPPLALAQETWRQVLVGFGPEYSNLLRAPNWYHLDDTLTWDPKANVYRNAAPFLINRPEDWDLRPGTSLKELLEDGRGAPPPGWSPAELAQARAMAQQTPEGVWYRMSWDSWVVAGTFMKTHTRMTTMEAANESARHAVNRILHHLAHRPRGVHGAPPSAGVLMGDYCPTWDPEANELEDMEGLRRIDRRLYERGMPHLFDLMQLERFAHATDPESAARLGVLLEAAREVLGGEGGPSGWFAELEREFKKWVSP